MPSQVESICLLSLPSGLLAPPGWDDLRDVLVDRRPRVVQRRRLQDDPGRPNWGGTDWFKIGQDMFSGVKISFVFSLCLFVFTWNQFSNTGFERKCLRSCYEDSWNFEDILLSHLFGYLDICYFVQGISERNLVQRTKHGNVDKI